MSELHAAVSFCFSIATKSLELKGIMFSAQQRLENTPPVRRFLVEQCGVH